MSKTQKINYYVLLVIITLQFVAAGIPKLLSEPSAAAGFTMAHLPLWFMYFIGVAELAGAIGLWIPRLQKWAVYGLTIILLGAIVVTAIFQSVVFAAFPLISLVILLIVYGLGKKRLATV